MTARHCGQCGAEVGPDDEFCRGCGSALSAGPPEWRSFEGEPPRGFVIGEVMRAAWRATLQNLPFLLLFTLVLLAVQAYVQFVLPNRVSNQLLSLLFTVAISAIAGLTQTTIVLAICDGRKATSRGLFAKIQLLPEYVGAWLLVTAIVTAGLFLLVVPGIFLALKFGFATFVALDRGASPLESLRVSSRLTVGQKWNLLKLVVVSAGVLILGFLGLFVGVLVAIPVTTIAYAMTYRRLLAQQSSAVPAPPPPR